MLTACHIFEGLTNENSYDDNMPMHEISFYVHNPYIMMEMDIALIFLNNHKYIRYHEVIIIEAAYIKNYVY